MRFLSFMLVVCIVFLSAIAGVAKPVPAEAKDCCKKMSKLACHKKPVTNKKTDDCNEPGCALMFSCSLCGFILAHALIIEPPQAHLLPKPVTRYITGNTAAYHADNWKPPKTCC